MALELSEEQKAAVFDLVALSLRTGFVAGYRGQPLTDRRRTALESTHAPMALDEWSHLSGDQLRMLSFVLGYGISHGEDYRRVQAARTARPLIDAEAERLEPTPDRLP